MDLLATDHVRSDVPVASGAGRIECSCGWCSSVRDDVYMYDGPPLYPDIERQWREHLMGAAPPEGSHAD